MVRVLGVKVISRVALMRVDDLDHPDLRSLAEEVAREHKEVRSVIAYVGVKGPHRLPECRHVFGDPPGRIVHSEYGAKFLVDPLRAMFCLGNSFERLRLAALTRTWETVVDMFAGVGQFSIPLAVHARPRKVYAIEVNESTYEYLRANVELNGVGGLVEPIRGDCREVIAALLRRSADRVVMGYLFGTLDYLESGLAALRRAGGMVHVHEVVRRGTMDTFSETVVREAERLGYRAEVVHQRVVKSYSPSREHVVVDLLAVPSKWD